MSTSPPGTEFLSRELAAIRTRTRRFLAASLVLHTFLFAGVEVYRAVTPDQPRLVEITWLGPEEVPGLPPVETRRPSRAVEETRSFVRETEKSAIAPLEQSPDVVADRMVQRLASRQQEDTRRVPISTLVDRHERPALQLPGIPGVSDAQAKPAQLVRERAAKPAPLARSEEKRAPPPPPVLTRLPEEKETPTPTRAPESQTNRDIAGASLVGPVADRRLVSYETPGYPEEAMREAIEGSVKLYFTVLPDGRVKENIMIEKTSGFDGFDRNAVAALRAWRFEPMRSGATGEQWGSITFHYRLSDRT